jgi:hypothetical protein
MLSSCGSSRYAKLRKRTRLSDAQGMSDSDKGYTTYSATYKSDGNLVRNIGGSIIAKAVNRQRLFLLYLDNNKRSTLGNKQKKV